MSEQVASQSDNVQSPSEDVVNAILRDQFGIEVKPSDEEEKTSEKALDTSGDDEEKDIEQDEHNEPPAKEEQKAVRKVKFNKKEVEVPEEQVEELLQKGLALDKEREKNKKTEDALKRAAKLHGYDSVDDYLTNLDKIEQESVKRQEDAFANLKKRMREEAEASGLDPDLVENYLENLPELKSAREILEREKQSQTKREEEEAQQKLVKEWEELFRKYPSLADETSEDGKDASWLTPEMKARIDRGYSPIDAYELVHRDKILAEERKRAEQKTIKDQRLNKRAAVEGEAHAEQEDDVPDAVKGAFAMFGLDPRTAKKFMKK